MKAYIVTRAGTFETVPLADYDWWEANGHDAFTDYLRAVLYYDRQKRNAKD